MKLHLFEHTCSDCGLTFKAPHLPPGQYGDILLRGGVGELALLRGLASPEYEEFTALLKACPEAARLKELQFADLLDKCFSAADFGEKGGALRVGDPTCPHCGSVETGDVWEATEPPQFLEWEPVTATFRTWASLDSEGRRKAVRASLDKALKG